MLRGNLARLGSLIGFQARRQVPSSSRHRTKRRRRSPWSRWPRGAPKSKTLLTRTRAVSPSPAACPTKGTSTTWPTRPTSGSGSKTALCRPQQSQGEGESAHRGHLHEHLMLQAQNVSNHCLLCQVFGSLETSQDMGSLVYMFGPRQGVSSTDSPALARRSHS